MGVLGSELVDGELFEPLDLEVETCGVVEPLGPPASLDNVSFLRFAR